MELYSNADDCHKLALLINNELKNKILFEGSTYQEVVSGTHSSFKLTEYQNPKNYEMDKLYFSYKYHENEFLRISISKRIYNSTLGHKLAALSDFYEVFQKHYGMPTLLYTLKHDDEESLNMQWSFIQKDEDIKEFKNNTAFDDASIEHLIIFSEENTEEETYISKEIGLPFELLPLVRTNINEYLYYKNGKILNTFEEKRYPTLTKKF